MNLKIEACTDLKIEACTDYVTDIRLLTNTASKYGIINGQQVRSWNGNTIKSREDFVHNGPKYGLYLLIASIISGIAAVVLVPSSFPTSLFFGSVALVCFAGVYLLKKIHGYVRKELKKQYALNAQTYLHGGPVEAFKRKCELGLYKDSDDLEMMEIDLETSLKVDAAFQAAKNSCNGVFKQKILESLKSQQARFERMREEDPQKLEDLVVSWFQGRRQESDRYCTAQRQGWSAPQIAV